MKLIEKLSTMVDEEIDDAGKYAKCAIKYKDERPELAKTFYDLSTDELRHMALLHAEVASIIKEYRAKHGEPPAEMQAVYDYLHDKQVDKAQEVKNAQAMYREM